MKVFELILYHNLFITLFSGGFCFCLVLGKVSYMKNGGGCLGDD